MENFFSVLYGDAEGLVPVVLYPLSDRNSGKPWKDWRLNKYEWFQWPAQADELIEFCKAHRKEDVYVTPALFKAEANTKANVKSLSVVHCDADDASPELFALNPTMIVESSPKRYQLYWKLDAPTPALKVEKLAQLVAYSQVEHGADRGFNMNKLLRVPGTTNTKPVYSNPKVKLTIDGGVYSAKQLKKAFGNVKLHKHQALSMDMPDVLPDYPSILSKLPANKPGLWAMIQEVPEVTSWNPQGSRFVVIHKLACSLFREGLTREEVLVVCQHSKSDKYAQDGRDPAELWRDVLNAEQAVLDQQIIFIEPEIGDVKLKLPLDTPPGVVLLNAEERKLIRRTFIEDYIDWAGTKTLADHRYHRANAMTILSTVLSEYAVAIPKFGQMPLHLWFMVMGVTSRSFKTTAAKYMKALLRRMSEGRENPYMLDEDATPEAMQVELSRRGETSSLYFVDEAQGLIADTKGGKSYKAGFTTLLTKLYDGEVEARSRTVAVSTEHTRTMVNVNMLGVPEKMANTLEREDFESGFLPRFNFIIGTPADRTPESMWLEQGDPNAARDRDPGIDELYNRLCMMRAKWKGIAKKSPDGLFKMAVEPDAWRRWNEFVLQLDSIAEKSADPAAISPSASRSTIAVHKLACLLAMADDCKIVKMRHMVTAIQYCEEWYDTLCLVVSMVHQNQWSRQVSELVDYIGVGRKQMSVVRRKFSGIKPRDFSDMVQTAEESGIIKRTYKETGQGKLIYLEKT